MRVKLTTQFIEAIKLPALGQVDYFDTKMTGLSLRVSQGGKKVWTLFYRFEGAQRRLGLGPYPVIGLADARGLASAALRDVHHGVDPAAAKAERIASDTFIQLTELYIERHAKPNKRTWERDQWLINRELLPYWRHRKAKDITRKDVIALLDKMMERGVPVLANRVKGLVSKVFNFGIARDIVQLNPAHGVSNPGGQERQRDRVLNDDEIRRVWAALDNEPAKVAAIYRLLLLTGQRKGEVCGMGWDEVDFDGATWTIAAERSKNGLSHRISLGPRALAILRTLEPAAEGFVFRGGKGGLALTNLQKPHRRIMAASGVSFRTHDLRRSAATCMTSIGIPRSIVSRILNHQERDVTRIYDRFGYGPEMKTALLKWNSHVERILAGEQQVSNIVQLRA
jgi:integrase